MYFMKVHVPVKNIYRETEDFKIRVLSRHQVPVFYKNK